MILTAAKVLSDLRWMLLSPPLLSGAAPFATERVRFDESELIAIETWLSAQTSDAGTALYKFVQDAQPQNGHPLRLGRYAERLLEYFLLHGPTHRLIASNVQVKGPPQNAFEDHSTRGELDFLVEDQKGNGAHWELALKFYLWNGQDPNYAYNFVGPEGTETLELKINKFVHRQLRIAVPAPYDDRTWQPMAFTRGRIFYPPGLRPDSTILDPSHCRGMYVQQQDIATLPHERFAILPRAVWLSAAMVTAAEAMTASQLSTLLASREAALRADPHSKVGPLTAVMVAGLARSAAGDTEPYTETARYFICSALALPWNPIQG